MSERPPPDDGKVTTPARDVDPRADDRPGDARSGDHDAADPAPGSSSPPDEPVEPGARVPRRRWSPRRRLAGLLIAGTIAIVAAVVVTRSSRRATDVVDTVTAPGGAALRAPQGPSVPGAPDGARLTGFVVDGAGAPVAGAEVTAELELAEPGPVKTAPAGSGSAAAAPTPIDPMTWPMFGGDGAGSAAASVAPVTAADGSFALVGLAPGRYRLRVVGVGLVPAEVRFVPVPSEATRIVVARQVTIEGTVTDGGQPAINVTVGLRGEAIGGTIEVKTGVTGTFAFPALPEGRYELFAWQQALAARTVRVQRLGVGPFAPIELRLEAATIVVGRVIDRAEGIGVSAAIELRPAGDDEAPRYARSASDGVFRIEGVPNGRWIADAYAHGYVSPGGVELDAGRGVPELMLSRGGVVTGRVLDGDGQPVAGAEVRVVGAGSASAEHSAAVEQDQLWRFSGRTSASVRAGPALDSDPLLIARGELGVLSGRIPPLPLPGSQRAHTAMNDPVFSALAGDPAPLPVDDPTRAPIWTTGADGHYRIWGLGKGTLEVLAIAPGFAEGRSRSQRIEPGQMLTDVDVELTRGTFVVGKVTDQHGTPVVGARVTAHPSSGAPLDTFAGLDGGYRLGPLVGAIRITATAYGHGEAAARIELEPAKGSRPGEHTLDLELVLADAVLAGTLDDGNGTAVAGAQLELVSGAGNGRHAIVAADGTFSIELLPPGPVRIRIRHPAYPPHVVEAIASAGGRERARLTLPLGGAVAGAVIDASGGAPLTGITVVGEGPDRARAEAPTDAQGRFRIGPLVRGTWQLSVKLAGFLPLQREVNVVAGRLPGDTTMHDVRLELLRGALVGGTVRDRRGQRMAAAAIEVRRRDGEGPTVEGRSDATGEFRLRDCPTGDLVVTASDGARRGQTLVTVRPGDEVLGLAIDLE